MIKMFWLVFSVRKSVCSHSIKLGLAPFFSQFREYALCKVMSRSNVLPQNCISIRCLSFFAQSSLPSHWQVIDKCKGVKVFFEINKINLLAQLNVKNVVLCIKTPFQSSFESFSRICLLSHHKCDQRREKWEF